MLYCTTEIFLEFIVDDELLSCPQWYLFRRIAKKMMKTFYAMRRKGRGWKGINTQD